MVFSFLLIFSINSNVSFAKTINVDTCQNTLAPITGIKDSLLLSTLTFCLPGVLEKAEELKQVKCEEVVCIYNSRLNGLDSSHCSNQRAYQECKYIYGEIFAIPGLNLVEGIRSAVATYVANPVAAIIALRHQIASCFGYCDVPSSGFLPTTLKLFDLAAGIERSKNIIANGFTEPSGTDYCREMESIKKEVNEILEFA